MKHPWIVNARRSDSIVPRKPTEYDEAVKSVQRWNEALKSPNAAGSLRRASRPLSSSPIPFRREPLPILATPAKGPLNLAKPRFMTEQFRSPENTADDNWDDDFASSISPSALQLPHLKPHDNFGGLLSSEKLKTYASFETVTEEMTCDSIIRGDLTTRALSPPPESDPLQTIRPYYHKNINTEHVMANSASRSPKQKESPKIIRQYGAASNLYQKLSSTKQQPTFSSIKIGSEIADDYCPSPEAAHKTTSDSRVMLKKV